MIPYRGDKNTDDQEDDDDDSDGDFLAPDDEVEEAGFEDSDEGVDDVSSGDFMNSVSSYPLFLFLTIMIFMFLLLLSNLNTWVNESVRYIGNENR
jgi:hypothetical protein